MSHQQDEAIKAGCLVMVIGLVLIGVAFGWQWAIGILGVLALILGITAALKGK